MTKHARFFLLPSFILISAALIAGCNDKGEEKAHVGEPQVTVHIVKTAPLEVKTELPGRTNAYRIAEVRPQVSGIVLNRNFTGRQRCTSRPVPVPDRSRDLSGKL